MTRRRSERRLKVSLLRRLLVQLHLAWLLTERRVGVERRVGFDRRARAVVLPFIPAQPRAAERGIKEEA